MSAEPASDPRPALAEAGAPPATGGRRIGTAILVGIPLAAVFLITTFTSAIAFTILIGTLIVVAAVEAGRVLHPRGWPLSVPILLLTSALALIGAYHLGNRGQILALGVLFLGAVLWELVNPARVAPLRGIASTVLFGLWVPFLASFAVLLAVRETDAPAAILATAGAAIITDIGGFAVGIAFGRRKVAPSVSPNKTWEGLIGGVALTVGLAIIVLPRMGDLFDIPTAALLGLLCGLAGFTGDLAESMIKRDLGIKDFGAFLPGHGGVLDRVDGILFALPVGYYVLELMGA